VPQGIPKHNPYEDGPDNPYEDQFGDVSGGSSTQQESNPHTGVDAAVDQMLFGFGDEAAAAIRSHSPFVQHGNYSQELAKEQRGAQAYKDAHPKENIAANVVGMLPTMLLPGSAALAKAGIAGTALGSAGIGALYGAGNAEEGHRLGGAARGAIVGGVAGAGTHLAVGATRALLEAIPGVNTVGAKLGLLRSPQQKADELLLGRMNQDKLTPSGVIQSVLSQSDTKPETLLDKGGRNVTGLGKRVVNTPGEANEAFRNLVDSRVDQAPTRISDDLSGAGMQHLDRHDTAEALLEAKRKTAAPLYEAALKGNPVDDPAINAWLQTPEGRAAFSIAQGIRRKEAEAAALAEGRAVTRADYELPQIYETGAMTQRAPRPGTGMVPYGVHAPDVPGEYEAEITKRGVPDDRTLHYLKLALDDMTKFGYVPPGGSASTRNFASKGLGKAFRQRIGELIPGYNDAAAVYSGGQHMEDAYQSGLGFLKQDASRSSHDIADMTGTEKELFKLGAGNAVRHSTGTAADGTDLAKRVFGSPEKRAQLEAAMNDPQAFGEFSSQMAREKRMAEVNRLQGGSQTFPMSLESDATDHNLGWLARFVGSPLRTTGYYLGKIQEGRNPVVTEAVGNRLLAGGKGGRAELLSALEALEKSSMPKFSKQRAIAALMAAATGQVAGSTAR
jgi:hypothetical protein